MINSNWHVVFKSVLTLCMWRGKSEGLRRSSTAFLSACWVSLQGSTLDRREAIMKGGCMNLSVGWQGGKCGVECQWVPTAQRTATFAWIYLYTGKLLQSFDFHRMSFMCMFPVTGENEKLSFIAGRGSGHADRFGVPKCACWTLPLILC